MTPARLPPASAATSAAATCASCVDCMPETPIAITYPSRLQVPSKLRAFIDFLRERLAPST